MNATRSRADVADRIFQVMALAAVLVAMVLITNTATAWVENTTAAVLELTHKVLVGVTLLVLLGLAVLIIRKWTMGGQGSALAVDDFTTELVRKSCSASWLLTLGFIVLADERLEAADLTSPVETFSALALSLMLASYGIAFLINDRRGQASSDETPGREH